MLLSTELQQMVKWSLAAEVSYLFLIVGVMTSDAFQPLPVQFFPFPLLCPGANTTHFCLDNSLSDFSASVWRRHHTRHPHLFHGNKSGSWDWGYVLPPLRSSPGFLSTPVEIKTPSLQSSTRLALHTSQVSFSYHPATLITLFLECVVLQAHSGLQG